VSFLNSAMWHLQLGDKEAALDACWFVIGKRNGGGLAIHGRETPPTMTSKSLSWCSRVLDEDDDDDACCAMMPWRRMMTMTPVALASLRDSVEEDLLRWWWSVVAPWCGPRTRTRTVNRQVVVIVVFAALDVTK